MKVFFLLFILTTTSVWAQDAVIAVGKAEQDKDKFVLDDPEMKSLGGLPKSLAVELTDIIKNDFVFYKHKFNSVDYSEKGQNSYSNPQLEKWSSGGISYFVASEISSSSGGIEAKYKAWSVLTKKEIFNKSFHVTQNTLRVTGHQIADQIYRSITGKPSIFNSKIVFVSDRTNRGKDTEKELYLMDFDGRRVEKLTDFNSIVLSPAVAPDNSKIMFSVIASHKEVSRHKVRTIKNIDLKVYDLHSKRISTLSDRPGINSGAIYSAKGDVIYLTLTYTGNADIYEMNLSTDKMRKITSNQADD